MEITEIQKRLNDLQSRCEKSGCVASSAFLTPAEVFENEKYYPSAVFTGGYPEAERKVAVFLPEWMEREDADLSACLSCVKLKSYFGTPSHRDYLGAILGLGISRDRIGDILIEEDAAYVFCLPSVVKTIVNDLSKAGRTTVKAEEIGLDALPEYERKTKRVSFTVKSLRLDAVAADMFSMSRTNAADAIRAGMVNLNYSVCEKCDAEIKENDVISLRGKGKGRIAEVGGRSRRDRLFVTAEIYI